MGVLVGLLVLFGAGIGAASAESFSGGGLSIALGTGSPNSVDAATALASDLGLGRETGSYSSAVHAFYQADRYRLGVAFQGQVWGGANVHDRTAEDGAAGVLTLIGGLHATYSVHHGRVLWNLGGTAGAGRCLLGFRLGDDGPDREANVATFFLEPLVSLGLATCPWFAVEGQLSSPIYVLTEDLELTHDGKTYTVRGSDLTGIQFGLKLTFGRIAIL